MATHTSFIKKSTIFAFEDDAQPLTYLKCTCHSLILFSVVALDKSLAIRGSPMTCCQVQCHLSSQTQSNKGQVYTMTTTLLFLFFFFSFASSSVVKEPPVCGDFVEGACDLSEHNIIDYNRHTETPEKCQVREGFKNLMTLGRLWCIVYVRKIHFSYLF